MLIAKLPHAGPMLKRSRKYRSRATKSASLIAPSTLGIIPPGRPSAAGIPASVTKIIFRGSGALTPEFKDKSMPINDSGSRPS